MNRRLQPCKYGRQAALHRIPSTSFTFSSSLGDNAEILGAIALETFSSLILDGAQSSNEAVRPLPERCLLHFSDWPITVSAIPESDQIEIAHITKLPSSEVILTVQSSEKKHFVDFSHPPSSSSDISIINPSKCPL
jgi:hypothetical protein